MSENAERLRRGFRGHAQIREFLDTLMDAWDEFRIEPEDFIERDDRLLVLVRVRTRARSSGIELDERWAHLWTARAGLAVRPQVFSDRRRGLEALSGSA